MSREEREETFDALDVEHQRRVTLKLLRTHGMDAKARETLERAMHQLRHVDCLHVQRVLDAGSHAEPEERFFLALEPLEGESLERRLGQNGPMTPQEALPLARQVCEGLAALHDAGLVHGDVRGGRVMLMPAPEGTRAVLTLPSWGWDSGAAPASRPYLAPERRADPAPSLPADLYALGLVLLELVAGAWNAPDSETPVLLEKLRSGPGLASGLGLPHRWEVVIRRCLDARPSRRFASAREAMRTLARPGWSQRDLGEPSVVIRTVLLLDLIDSTRLVETIGDTRAAELFARHDQLARELLRLHGGQEIDKTDGFLLLFERPVDATRYALAYQERLAVLEREQGVHLEARAGIHLGEVILRENPPDLVAGGAKPLEVEGLTKLIAARVMSLARGGQILLTRVAFDMARRAFVGAHGEGWAPTWRIHGFYMLAGVEEPVEVGEVGVGHQSFAAPEDTAKARRVGPATQAPPAPPPPRASKRSRGVLLLLCGLALALLVGAALWPKAPRSAPIDASRPQPRRAVAVLGFDNLSGKPDTAWLATAITALLTAELALGEELRLVDGQTVVRVKRELLLPESESLAPDTLTRVCTLLDTDYVVLGSYLAMPKGQGGDVSLQVTLQDARGNKVILQRKGSLEDILILVKGLGEQLRGRLVTPGAMEDGGTPTASRPANATALRLYAEGLAQLRDHDPLSARDSFTKASEADPRFALAHSALAEAWAAIGYDTRAVQEARAALALDEGLSREERLLVKGRAHEMEKNWEEAVSSYRELTRLFPDNLDYGLRLASAQAAGGMGKDALATLTTLRAMPAPASNDERIDLAEAQVRHSLSDYEEVLPLAARAVDKGTARGSRLLVGRARLAQCNAQLRLGRHAEAGTACEQARQIFIAAGDPGSEGQTLNRLANIAYEQGDYEEAKRLFQQALDLWRVINHRGGTALALQNIADTLMMQGQLDLAEPRFQEALDIERDINDRRNEGLTRINLAQLRLLRGEPASALTDGEEGVRLSQETGYRYALGMGLWTLGNIAFARGQLEEAHEHYARGLTLSRQTQDHRYAAYHHQGEGTVALMEGDLPRARSAYTQALSLRQKLQANSEVAETQVFLGLLAAAEGQPETGREFLKAAAQTLRKLRLPDGEAQAYTALARVELAVGRIDAARVASAQAQKHATHSQQAQTRLGSALVAARVLLARDRPGEALPSLNALIAETHGKGLVLLEYEARMMRVEAELALGWISSASKQRRILEQEARERGLQGFTRQVAETFKRKGPPGGDPR
ncbi:tetratricopeptide repeat protein [Melittangium boletus]|nr:tetratricopeptide repeat protein [Melittangium boletus]